VVVASLVDGESDPSSLPSLLHATTPNAVAPASNHHTHPRRLAMRRVCHPREDATRKTFCPAN
jgi:hypothetical protein